MSDSNGNAPIDISKLTVDQLAELESRVIKTIEQIVSTKSKAAKRQFYESLDWTKSNPELATQHGLSIATIHTWRFKLNKHLTVRQTKYWPACKNWDWTLSNSEIARKEKVQIKSVADYRKILGMPDPPRDYAQRPAFLRLPQEPKKDYSALDWDNKADIELARETGLSGERIRQIRAELGLPKRHMWELKLERFKKIFAGVKELSFNEARQKFPCARNTFIDYCLRSGITVINEVGGWPTKYPWEKMDWRLPNFLLAKIWNIKTRNLIASHRSNHCLPKAEFVYIMGNYPAKYQKLIDAQIKLAAEHYG